MNLSRLLRLTGRCDEDIAATVAGLIGQGRKSPHDVGHLVQKAMTAIAEVDPENPRPAATLLHGLARDLGDKLDRDSFIAALIRTIPEDGLDHHKADRILSNIVIRKAKQYLAHPRSDVLWAKLVSAAG